VNSIVSLNRLGLGDRVLADRGVEHEEGVVRPLDLGLGAAVGLGERLGARAADLLQLVHQLLLGVQAAGGVAQDHVEALAVAAEDALEDHRRRVGLVGALVDRAADPAGPDLELLARRGAERVARDQQHLAPRGLVRGRQLAQRRRLADPVDPDHQQHVRASVGVKFSGGAGLSRIARASRRITPHTCAASATCSRSSSA
jgi:hypothetical protein